MSIDLPSSLQRFRVYKDFVNETASFRTNVPWIGSEGYLNTIYRPAPTELLAEVAAKLHFPAPVFEFLSQYNGARLFSGGLSLYGVVEPGRLMYRDNGFALPPLNIVGANKFWRVDPERLLVIGVYYFDSSVACIDRSSGQVLYFKKDQTTPELSWPSFDSWLREEIDRLRSLFDADGRILVDVSETVPHGTRGTP